MSSKLFPVQLVGAGPGDPELLTLKALRALTQADVILIDDLVDRRVLEHARAEARIVHVGKRGGCKSTSQAFINRLLVHEAQRGARVVRLKGGDPFVFGRGAEEAEALRAAGLEVEVIPGISAGIAAPSAIGVPVTDRRYARGVVFVTGHSKTEGEDPDWHALAQACLQNELTLVIYMGITHCGVISKQLMSAGLSQHTPAAVIQHAHTPQQRSHVSTLAHLAADIKRLGLGSPAILVIGDVVKAAVEIAAADLLPQPLRAAQH